MLSDHPIAVSLPTSDVERSRAFYEGSLGFKMVDQMEDGRAYYQSADSFFFVYPSQFAGTNKATAAGWLVDDVDAIVADLKANGVTFEDYDLETDFGQIKTVDGIATLDDGTKGGWFKDPDGNILSVFSRPE